MKRKKLIVSLVMLAMAVNLSACRTKTDIDPSKQSANKSEDTKQTVDYYKKMDPVVSLTQNVVNNSKEFPQGKDVNNNSFIEWAEKTVGIKWSAKWDAPNNEVNTQKLNLAIISNDLPDVIRADKATIAKLAASGAILPLNEYMDKYLSPLSKYLLEEIDKGNGGLYWSTATVNGKIYGLPHHQDNVSPQLLWYRKDILDKMGMGIPKTIDDLDAVLAKYKEFNPKGVGIISNKGLTSGINSVMNAYGAYPGIWLKDKDGKLAYGTIQPEVKDALAKLREYYEKGYLDKEFVVKDGGKAAEAWVAGNALMLQSEWYTVWGDTAKLSKGVSEAVTVPGPYLKGPKGDYGAVQISGATGSVVAINAKCKNPEAVFYAFNWWADSAFRNHDDLRAKFQFKYGKEDEQIALNTEEKKNAKEGQVVLLKYNYKQQGPNNGQGTGFLNEESNTRNDMRYGFIFNQRVNQLRDQFLRTTEAIRDNKVDQLSTGDKMEYEKCKTGWGPRYEMLFAGLDTGLKIATETEKANKVRINQFAGPTTETQLTKGAYLKKIEDETIAKIILKELPLEAFDDFVKNWRQTGGDQVTKEVNDWAQSQKSK